MPANRYTDKLSPPRDVVCGLLNNMGGRRALQGNLLTVSTQSLLNAKYSPHLNGLGWNPEDLNCNPVKWVRAFFACHVGSAGVVVREVEA